MATERGAGTPPVEILERHFGAVAARTIARQLSHVFERSFSFATLVEPLRAAQFRGVDEKEGQPRRMETHYARALKSVRASVLFLTSWVRADNVNVRDITVERASVDELEAYDQSAAFVRRDGALAATWRAICAVAERLWGAMNDVAHVADMCAVCGLNDVIRENGIIQAPLFFRELARRSIAAVVEDVAKRTHSTLIVDEPSHGDAPRPKFGRRPQFQSCGTQASGCNAAVFARRRSRPGGFYRPRFAAGARRGVWSSRRYFPGDRCRAHLRGDTGPAPLARGPK